MIFRGLAPEPLRKNAAVLRWVGVVASIGIVIVTTVAAVDHVRKSHSIQRANVSAWFCNHQGTRCDKTNPDTIEDAWSRRERVYKAADVGLFLLALGAVIAVRRRR
jgi:hypothetical protein